MAKLTREDILKLARLSRLHLNEDEIKRYAGEINNILEYVEILQDVNLDDYEPTYQVTGLTNVVRPDEVVDYAQSKEELLKNAPHSEAGQIKVRRMLG